MPLHHRFAKAAAALFAATLVPAALAEPPAKSKLSATEIIAKSSAVTQADFKAYPNYSHTERDRDGTSDKTYRVKMIDGSPYQELIAVNGRPLSPQQQKQEQIKLRQEIAKRNAESPDARRQRIANYERDRQRDNTMMQQLTAAFDFELLRTGRIESFDVYILKATPKEGYNPPNMDSEVLPGMQGRLWIDEKTFQWVKVTAQVIHPVSIMGFLAKVQPGTRFELEKRPIGNGVWAPSHFSMHANALVLGFFSHKTQQDQVFSDYTLGSE